MQTELLAKYLCNRQPLQIRTRLLSDGEFASRFSLIHRTVMTIGTFASIERGDLLSSARRALVRQGEERVLDADEHELVIKADQGRVILKRPGNGGTSAERHLDDLLILSPNSGDRVRALDQLINRFGPTAPDFSSLRRVAGEREFDEREIDEILGEAVSGVAAVQARAAIALKSGQVILDDIAPNSLAYFERFCGPDSANMDPEAYLTTVLPAQRKALLARDLPSGLSICLLGALRDDLSPGAWTEHLQDNALWDALGVCDPWHEPFSLLGALDIALGRQHDERYREFSEKAVMKLVAEKFPRADGIDTYEWLPLLAEVVLNRIHTLEGGATCAPYWKRMCAWMQAGLLVRITSSLALDFQQTRKWMEANTSAAGVYANLLDLRREPMVRASSTSRQDLYDEVLGRLKALQVRHAGAGRTTPRVNEIDKAISQLADHGSPFGWVLPGPLEGHRRPVGIGGRGLPDQIASHLVDRLSRDPTGPVWRALAHLSQCFDIGNDVLEQTRRACLEKGSFEQDLERLADAGVVASSQGDKELARSILSLVKERAPEARSGQDAVILLRVLLIASAAFDDERGWSNWLEEQLSDLAVRLPTGKISETFLAHLREIKTVLPLTSRVVNRAEAVASAAS